jgi:hypothetical protein
MEIHNFIPKYQNQDFQTLKNILLNMPDIPKMNNVYHHVKTLIKLYPHIIRIDIINGLHESSNDFNHFNIRIYDKRTFSIIYDNLHVYVTNMEINRFMQITL